MNRVLFPNEHGAWGMFFTAFLTGWLATSPFSWRPLLLLPAALGLFLARYPAGLYFKKRRIARALKISLDREKKWFFFYTALTTIFALPLFYPLVWWWLLPFASIALLVFGLHLKSIRKREERSLTTELSGMAGLSLLTPAASYAALLKFEWETVALWILLFLFYTQRIIAIRGRIKRKKEIPVDLRALGKRELIYSAILVITLSLLMKLIP